MAKRKSKLALSESLVEEFDETFQSFEENEGGAKWPV
jgi:hypothetical protein